jgi:nicotinamide mononucleotide transporter
MYGEVIEFLLAMLGSRPIEIAAVCFGLVNVALIIHRSIWNYPFGIVMVILYADVFFYSRLYSDALLQIFFLVIQLYGWWYWWKGRGRDGRIVVERATGSYLTVCAVLAVVGSVTLGTVMARLTDAAFPYWDGSIAVLSVIAQFLLSRRRLESWMVWIAVDVLAVALFWTKELKPTAALYGVFLVLAVFGFRTWRHAWQSGKAVA